MDSEVQTAIKQIRDEAQRLETGHGYPMVSVRKLHRDLGIEVELERILAACAERGFDYCLDSTIASIGPDGPREFPAQSVCSWGPDQLRSRLDYVL